jgi:hypothetical protein
LSRTGLNGGSSPASIAPTQRKPNQAGPSPSSSRRLT